MKRNPYLGIGLDKRQARRARRRAGRRAARYAEISQRGGFRLDPWQRDVVELLVADDLRNRRSAAAVARPKTF